MRAATHFHAFMRVALVLIRRVLINLTPNVLQPFARGHFRGEFSAGVATRICFPRSSKKPPLERSRWNDDDDFTAVEQAQFIAAALPLARKWRPTIVVEFARRQPLLWQSSIINNKLERNRDICGVGAAKPDRSAAGFSSRGRRALIERIL